MHARFDDLVAGRAMVCGEPTQVLQATRVDQVLPVLRELDAAVAEGAWAYGFVAYEAAAALGLCTRPPTDGLPLVWFGLCEKPTEAPIVARGPGEQRAWSLDWTASEHASRVAAVRAEIAKGETYQANLTTRMRTDVADAASLYADLAHSTGGAFCAFLDLGRWAICSASPELLVQRDGDHVLMRPMKGTAARGLDLADDARVVAALRGSDKERAENLMIVDLVRNDLSRVADDVRATVVGRVERYPSVWQLTSDVVGRLRTTSVADLLAAVFPCGSVTGAPKASTMTLLASLEDSPRGVYCGAVGLVGPPTATFSVPIRTAVVDRSSGTAVYGTGGGVTWSSDPVTEWAELLAKAPRVEAERRLLQTMRYCAGVGVVNADRHVAHLAASAMWLGFACDTADLLERLASVEATGDLRVRLLLGRDGSSVVETHTLPAEPPVQVLAIDPEPIDAGDRWLRHKSDERSAYATRLARHPDATDVVLVNADGFVTETARANLLVRLDGRWVTPPVSDGLLPGVGRELLLQSGDVVERSVTVAECHAAQAIATVSSLWGRRDAVLLSEPRTRRLPYSSAGSG